MSRDTSQSFVNVKPSTPNCLNAFDDSSVSLTKKYAISRRIAAASPVRPQRSALSGRCERQGRQITGWPPPTDAEPAFTQPLTGEPLQVRLPDTAFDFVRR